MSHHDDRQAEDTMSGPFGTATGIYRWFDPVTNKGYLLSLEDGYVQAAMIGEGITAADENILLDASGLTLYDMTGASIITPMFGVGMIHNVLLGSESFSASYWTLVGTASKSTSAVVTPKGDTVAILLTLPASGDGIKMQSMSLSPSLEDGQSAAWLIWLRADSSGPIRLWIKSADEGTTLGTLDCDVVGGAWRRFALIATNSMGSSQRCWVGIERASSGQLDEVYIWGAQLAYDISQPVPYISNYSRGNKMSGTVIDGLLFMPDAVIIGNSWATAPSGIGTIAIGAQAGSGSTAGSSVLIGNGVANNSSGSAVIYLGQAAGANSSGTNVVGVGTSTNQNSAYNDAICLGYGAKPTADHQIVLGSFFTDRYFTDLFGGGGVSQASPPDFRINATGGEGTDIAGGALNLAGGRGTGTGAGGDLVLQTAPAGASGSSQNALVDRLTIGEDGTFDFHSNPVTNWSGPGGGGSVTRWRLSFGA